MINTNTKLLFAFAFWLFATPFCSAQDTISSSIQQKLEDLTESSKNEDADYTTLLEIYSFYKLHPINLNSNAGELSNLGLLNDLQIENLLSHLEKNGKLLNINELQSIDGFDLQTIEKIIPYIYITDVTDNLHESLSEMLKKGNHDVLIRYQQVLEKQKGFSPTDSTSICQNPNSRYIGGPQKIYARYRFSYNSNISIGITGEKDPGELFFKKNNSFNYPYYDSLLNGKQNNGFDFYSAHLFVRNIGLINALAIGDYQIGFGQGLTTWSGIAYGKNFDALTIKKNASGIRPYTSVDENRFMRGIAITAGSKSLQVTGFLSRKKLDANSTYLDSSNTIVHYTLQSSGLHATPSEISDKNRITQTIAGGNISIRKRKYTLGFTGMNTFFEQAINHSLTTYNQFEFTGKSLTNFGADYSVLLHNFNFFGELGVSTNSQKSSRLAYLNGCLISLDPKVSLSILHRYFPRDYQSFSANAFSENSTPNNEQGIYLGINIKPSNTISINAYYDHFTFPWLKYQIDAPSNGSEYLVQLNFNPSKKLETYLRIKQKDKFSNSNTPDEIDFILPYKQINYRWQIGYYVSRSLKLSNRIECVTIQNNTKENGFLVYQDATWKRVGSKISLIFRYALFDTKSFDSRIYAFEHDLPGSYSIPSYYNKGSKVYLLINYNITRHLEFWIRCSQLYYSNQSVISAGTLNEIQGHTKTEVKMALRMRL